MIPGLITAGASMINPALGPVASAVDAWANKPKDRPPLSGAEAGSHNRDFMQASFPGTTPWEWIGASSNYGSAGGPENQSRTQERLQSRELDVRERIADKQNRTNLLTSLSPMGASVVNSGMKAYQSGSGMPEHDTQLKQARERLAYETRSMDAHTRQAITQSALAEVQKGLTEAEIPTAVERAKKAGWIVNAEIAERYGRILANVIGSGVGAFTAGSLVGRRGFSPINNSSRGTRSSVGFPRKRSNFDIKYGVYDSTS